jgi:hypothetical protein
VAGDCAAADPVAAAAGLPSADPQAEETMVAVPISVANRATAVRACLDIGDSS